VSQLARSALLASLSGDTDIPISADVLIAWQDTVDSDRGVCRLIPEGAADPMTGPSRAETDSRDDKA
jgi:hypothetical protein